MAAKNQQPFGSRPGPKAAQEHDQYKGSKPDGGKGKPGKGLLGESGVAAHGTPSPTGAGKKNPLH